MMKSLLTIFLLVVCVIYSCKNNQQTEQEKKLEQLNQQITKQDSIKSLQEVESSDEPKIESNSQENQTHEKEATSHKRMAVINDPDGYTNLRSGKSTNSKIITQINENERFEILSSTGNWWKVKTPSNQTGYIHKSRVKELFESKSSSDKSLKITTVDFSNLDFPNGTYFTSVGFNYDNTEDIFYFIYNGKHSGNKEFGDGQVIINSKKIILNSSEWIDEESQDRKWVFSGKGCEITLNNFRKIDPDFIGFECDLVVNYNGKDRSIQNVVGGRSNIGFDY